MMWRDPVRGMLFLFCFRGSVEDGVLRLCVGIVLCRGVLK